MKKRIVFLSRHKFMSHIESLDRLDSNDCYISINCDNDDRRDMCNLLSSRTQSADDYSRWKTFTFLDVDSVGQGGMAPCDAESMLYHINKNRDKRFIVHCLMGVSRSGAVAKFINDYLGLDDSFMNDYNVYNRHVYNKLMSAAGLSLASYYEELEKEERML